MCGWAHIRVSSYCHSMAFRQVHTSKNFYYSFFPLATVQWNASPKSVVCLPKKGKRKVQGVPQSQTAALPRPQEEEETDKSKQAQTEQTYEKH